MSHHYITNAQPGTQLTQREYQILVRIAEGLTNEEIGAGMFLSPDTIKTHLQRMFRRLGAHNRAHAVGIAYRNGLLIPGYERVA